MSRLAYDAVSGVSPATDVPPAYGPRPSYAASWVAAYDAEYPRTIQEQVTAAIHAEQRRRERELRQAAFLWFGVHL